MNCQEYKNFKFQIYEIAFWSLIILTTYRVLRIDKIIYSFYKDSKALYSNNRINIDNQFIEKGIDLVLFFFNLLLLYLVMIEIRSKNILYIFNSCFFVIVIQIIALSTKSYFSIVLSIYLLPFLPYSIITLNLFFDLVFQNSNFKSYSLSFFLIIHATPIYLISRNKFAGYKLSSFSSILVGSWFFLIYQWWIVSPISFFSHVNIDLFMCQKNYITETLFGSPLKFISLYNYRSIFSILIFPFCILIAYLYIAVTGVLFFVLSFAAIKHNIDEVDRGIEKKNI